MLAVMAIDPFMIRFGLTAVGGAKQAGLLLQVNEKKVRTWKKEYQFYSNNGSFSESNQGKHWCPFVQDDEECRRKAASWVPENAT